MPYRLIAQGRRMSDGQHFVLDVTVDADTPEQAKEMLEQYDWEDAASRDVSIFPADRPQLSQ